MLRLRVLTSLALVSMPLLALPGLALATDPPPPELNLTLTPHATAGGIDRLDISMQLEKPNIAAGATLVRMPLLIVSTPTARYDGEAVKAEDDAGPLPLTATDEKPTPTGTYRHWAPDRATSGNVHISYGTPPRQVDEKTRNGPLFDLRAEAGGLDGAGITFLAIPDTKHPYKIHLRWDLSGTPAGTRAVWSLGEGTDVSRVDVAETLAFTYYYVGPVQSFPDNPSGNFHLYWLSDPPFDTRELAARIQTFHAFAEKFFKDTGSSYRVFTRRNPYRGGGGTALRGSFMFGYGIGKTPSLDDLRSMLAHEMTHNWPSLEGEHGDTAWYTEGTAEYYSILLSYRSGSISGAKFLGEINERATGYYTNPYVKLANPQAAEKFWSDANAQRVPYGRGFMYFARVDAQARAKSNGKRSLDDLVLDILNRQRKEQKYGVPEWREIITREIGPQAVGEFDAMVAGKLIVPPESAFAPCLKPEAFQERPFKLGFDDMRLNVVKDLQADSPAAKAGLKEGDDIVEISDHNEIKKHPGTPMVVKVKRGDRTQDVSYLPLGDPVPSYHWVQSSKTLDAHCKF